MVEQFNYKQYWITRLKNAKENLTGVGHKRFGANANRLMYKKAEEVLVDTISSLPISLKGKKVIDAGAGIGMFCGVYLKRGAKVTAVDISKEALAILKKKYRKVATKVMELERIDELGEDAFDILHCFDVLYHITDDRKWKKTVENFAFVTKKFIIIHDKFPYLGYQFFEKGHVKVRKKKEMMKLLKKHGFTEIRTIQTHSFFVRPILHIIVGKVPEPFYYFDKLLYKMNFRFFQTSYIRVFEKNG